MLSFDFTEVENFDQHIGQSIPALKELDELLRRGIHHFAQAGTTVIDVGCSEGRLLRSIPLRPDVRYIGIDKSMTPRPREGVEFVQADVLNWGGYEGAPSSVIVAVFTAQFMPMHQRAAFLADCYHTLVKGGVLFIAEKTHCASARLESTLQAQLMEFKRGSFTDTEIVEKAVGLAPVMHLQTEEKLREELSMFDTVDPIWRWGNFGCWAAIKD